MRSVAFFLCGIGWVAAAGADEGAVFDRLDANADGQVTAGEAEHQRLFQRLLRTSDANADGRLSKAEFLTGVTRQPSTADAPLQTVGQPRPTDTRQFDPQQVLTRFDRNGEEKLSRTEAPGRLRENFDRVDRDADGFVDAEELTQLAAFIRKRNKPDKPRSEDRPEQARIAALAERLFSARDANEDGRLSPEEVPPQRREGFRRMLRRLDVSAEQGLTKQQFTEALGQVLRRRQMQQPPQREGRNR